MYAIGVMPMPAGFKYRDVLLKGKPRHDRYDSFRIRHPEMSPGKRAKLFAPFDALRGFDFAILMKNEIYTDKAGLSPEDQEELDRRFSILHKLTYNSRMARANRVRVMVTYYEACSDVNRLRCVSFDDTPYINEEAKPYDGLYREPNTALPCQTFRLQKDYIDYTDEKALHACEYALRHHIDMTMNYLDWMKIGFALASLGEFGRELFHMVSSVSEKYNAHETDRKFSELLRSGNRIGIGTFFHYCQQYGIRCDGSR